MGQNRTIYLSDDVIELIDKIEGKGTIINNMIRDYFSNDEEALSRKLKEAERTYFELKAKLENITSEKQKIEALKSQKKIKSEEQKKRDLEVEEIKKKWQNNEITEEEYWAFFDKK